MSARGEITRAAWREHWRRWHPASTALLAALIVMDVLAFKRARAHDLALLPGLAASARALPLPDLHLWPWGSFAALLYLVGVRVPSEAAAGVSRWVTSGPLGILGGSARGGDAVVGYGLGTALWSLLPAALMLAFPVYVLPSLDGAMAVLLTVGALFCSAWIGAAVGRWVRQGLAARLAATGAVLGVGLLTWALSVALRGSDWGLPAAALGLVPALVARVAVSFAAGGIRPTFGR
jgi:hypothetical protein